MTLLSVRDLHVSFQMPKREVKAVRGVSFDLEKGKTLALVGESGSGKSVTALSLMKLLPYPKAFHPHGEIIWNGEQGAEDVLKVSKRRLKQIRGQEIGIIFQEPMTALNPLHTIKQQIAETLKLHKGMSGKALEMRIHELLEQVGLARLIKRLNAYPHELSGGQRQRVMIAMALANTPELLIADEPTTALDVTVEVQVLKLLKDLQAELGMAILLITHDLGIVEKFADETCVMRNGKLIESGPTEELFKNPQDPYTRELITADPNGAPAPLKPDAPLVLETENLKVWFPIKRGFMRKTVDHVKAVNDVEITLKAGETLGVVGESGSGKTTLAMAILRLVRSEGRVVFLGREIQGLAGKDLRPLREELQIVFQDPYGALSPRLSVAEIIGEGLRVHRPEMNAVARDAAVVKALKEVHLPADIRHRYPHEFSGGQRQRIAIARALVLEPKLIVLDEPTSALDRAVQLEVIDLLRDLQAEKQLSYVFISHDLQVVRAMSHRILVLKDGKIIEQGTANALFENPQADYTQGLLKAALRVEL